MDSFFSFYIQYILYIHAQHTHTRTHILCSIDYKHIQRIIRLKSKSVIFYTYAFESVNSDNRYFFFTASSISPCTRTKRWLFIGTNIPYKAEYVRKTLITKRKVRKVGRAGGRSVMWKLLFV